MIMHSFVAIENMRLESGVTVVFLKKPAQYIDIPGVNPFQQLSFIKRTVTKTILGKIHKDLYMFFASTLYPTFTIFISICAGSAHCSTSR